jgi:hypothetical protein
MLKLANGGIAVALLALAACSSGSDAPSRALGGGGTPVGDTYMANAEGAVVSSSEGATFSPASASIGMMGDTPRQSMPLSQAIQLAERPTGEMFVHDIPGRKLVGDEIVQVAAGNTMVGPRLSVHYGPSGDAEMQIFSQQYSGEWRVSGNDMMCHSFPSFAPWSGNEVCYEWYLDGNRLSTFEPVTGAGATRGENILVAGNRIN